MLFKHSFCKNVIALLTVKLRGAAPGTLLSCRSRPSPQPRAENRSPLAERGTRPVARKALVPDPTYQSTQLSKS